MSKRPSASVWLTDVLDSHVEVYIFYIYISEVLVSIALLSLRTVYITFCLQAALSQGDLCAEVWVYERRSF